MAVVVTTNLLLAAVAMSPNSFPCSLLGRRCPIIVVRIVFLRPTLGQACRRICCDPTFGPWPNADYWTAWRDIRDCWSKKKCQRKIILYGDLAQNNNNNNVYSSPQQVRCTVYSCIYYAYCVFYYVSNKREVIEKIVNNYYPFWVNTIKIDHS